MSYGMDENVNYLQIFIAKAYRLWCKEENIIITHRDVRTTMKYLTWKQNIKKIGKKENKQNEKQQKYN